MKPPRSFLFSVLSGLAIFLAGIPQGFAESSVTVSELQKTGDNQGSMYVELRTTDDPTAFEMDLLFDQDQVEVTAPVALQVPGAAVEEYSLDSNLISKGRLRVVLSSAKLKPIASGTSMRVPVRAAKSGDRINNYLPVTVSNMELSDQRPKSLQAKLGTTVRVRLESGVKYDGRNGLRLELDVLKEEGITISKVEYLVNGVTVQTGTGVAHVTWRPPGSGAFELTARVTTSDGKVVESRMLPLIVTGLSTRPVNSIYSGTVVDASVNKSSEATGMVTFATTTAGSLGAYSMRLILNGMSVGAVGRFGSESIGTSTLKARTASGSLRTYRMQFQQEATGLADTIRGVLTDGSLSVSGTASGGSFVSNFVAYRNIWTPSLKETGGMAGRYTVSFADVNGFKEERLGIGLISVGSLGVVSAAFTLSDGIKVTQSGWIAGSGVWQPYSSLYLRKGFLLGTIDFSDKSQAGAVGGSLDWRRSSQELRELDLTGGKYAMPSRGTVLSVKGFTNNLRMTISGGSLSAPIVQTVSLTPFSTVSVPAPNNNKLSINIDRERGGFSGNFLLPEGRSARFEGAIFQADNYGVGVFVPYGTAGTFGAGTVKLEVTK